MLNTVSDFKQFLCLFVRSSGYPDLKKYTTFPSVVPTWGDPHVVQRCCCAEHPASREATVRDDVQDPVLKVGQVEVKYLLKRDGAISEDPVSCPRLTDASEPDHSCMQYDAYIQIKYSQS